VWPDREEVINLPRLFSLATAPTLERMATPGFAIYSCDLIFDLSKSVCFYDMKVRSGSDIGLREKMSSAEIWF
jgi:hypothetical protein